MANLWIRYAERNENGEPTKGGKLIEFFSKESLMGNFDRKINDSKLIGRISENISESNSNKELSKRFNVGCWTIGYSVYDDISAIRQITNKDIWIQEKQEIYKHISPVVAFSIVKSLGFKGVLCEETEIIKLESVESWWSNLSDENKRLFTIDWERIPIEIPLENVIKLIKINIQTCKEHLNIRKFKNVNFIKHIVAFLNSNPMIINVNLNINNMANESQTSQYSNFLKTDN